MSEFSVGDRVRLVKVNKLNNAYEEKLKKHLNEIAKINHKCNKGAMVDYGIKFDDGSCFNVQEDEIELVQFEVGDEVVAKFDGCYAEGVIDAIYPDKIWAESMIFVKFGNRKIGFNPDQIKLKSELEDIIVFPEDFYKKNGVDIDNKEINKWIKEIQQGEYDNVSSGNTLVIKRGNSIVVAKDYWEYDLG